MTINLGDKNGHHLVRNQDSEVILAILVFSCAQKGNSICLSKIKMTEFKQHGSLAVCTSAKLQPKCSLYLFSRNTELSAVIL